MTSWFYRYIELSSDPTIRSHLAALYDTLLEQNLLRIVEPYSVVELEYVAQQVKQERQSVEIKLSQMILDKVLDGVLDQGRGCLLLFDEADVDVRNFFSVRFLYPRTIVDFDYRNRICMARRSIHWVRSGKLSNRCMPRYVKIQMT